MMGCIQACRKDIMGTPLPLIILIFGVILSSQCLNTNAQGLSMHCPDFPPVYQVFCGNAGDPTDCILSDWLCDGTVHCANGLDESPATCDGADPCEGSPSPCPPGARCTGYSYQERISVAYAVCQCAADQPCEAFPTTLTITPPLSLDFMAGNMSSSLPRDLVPLAYPLANTAVSSCQPNPCLNGVCTPLRDGINCNCRPGYAGMYCEAGIYPCASQPCFNGGLCESSGTAYNCRCALGFYGRQCEHEQNECVSDPCQHGGTCNDAVARYTCDCQPGYAGNNCELDVNECASSPCSLADGGRCVQGINMFTCECPATRAGQFCERQQDCLDGDPCQNYGICLLPMTEGEESSCYCLAGFSGTYCSINNDECASNPCSRYGNCVDGVNSYTCACNPGYTGIRCEVEIDPCDPNLCENGAFCCRRGKQYCAENLPVNYFECYCPQGYTGSRCERVENPCSPDPCQNGGMCSQLGQDYTCTCPLTFAGRHCDTATPCASEPCLNNGQCVVVGGQATCRCSSIYYGDSCELVLPCLSQPCLNGATCVNHDGGNFTCHCTANHEGATCSIALPCASQPCRNGGACSVQGASFSCSCPPQYAGTQCEQLLVCSSQPCRNGGSCTAIGTTYICECLASFTGRQCEQYLPCATQPCANGGVCMPDGTSYTCQCPGQYTGINCENLVACASNPCFNTGQCISVGDTYQCVCPRTYTGTRCETPLPCASSPCQNNGICQPSGSSYTCSCTPSFTGTICETYLQCSAGPCVNGGTCLNLLGGGFQCVCASGFTGSNCATPILCQPNPCLNDGRCIVTADGHQCICPVTYIGPNCEIYNPCLSFPCQHGGDCVRTVSGYTCDCPSSYTGTFCETLLPCASSPCLGGGTCINQGLSFTCTCPATTTGTLCQYPLSCGSNPCLNEARCFNDDNNFFCLCSAAYSGIQCEILLACSSSPCAYGSCVNVGGSYECVCQSGYVGQNCNQEASCTEANCFFGSCQNQQGQLACVCMDGYAGPFCEHQIMPCDSTPCQNGGSCSNAADGSGFECRCTDTFQGPTCNAPVQPCDSSPCFNQGVCTNAGDDFLCACSEPYFGPRCEFSEGACDNEPCLNGGECLEDGTGGFLCGCQLPYAGTTCEEEVTDCDPNPCQHGGSCFTDSLGVFCACVPPFQGLLCQLTASECDIDPCRNGGTCRQVNGFMDCNCPSGTVLTSSFRYCDCVSGYTGDFCDQVVNGCSSSPCANGECVEDSAGRFQCSCPPGWVGDLCQVPNPCRENPCSNGGVCHVTSSGYRCDCLPGFSGSLCELSSEVLACQSQPCQNGGTCSDFGSAVSFVCTCNTGYTGARCEVDINFCEEDNRCQNGGICQDEEVGISCDCPPGFSGEFCTTEDSCQMSPCRNGATCLATPNPTYGTSFTCQCSEVYEGPNCEQYKYCRSNPCSNGADCFNQGTSFSCVCPPEYTGPTCLTLVSGCQGIDCSGRGTCVPRGQFGYQCLCEPGYLGEQCQDTACQSDPCESGGQCRIDGEGYVCSCPQPRAGINCETDFATITPFFSSGAYMQSLPPPSIALSTSVSLLLRPHADSGLILFAGEEDLSYSADYLVLGLQDGHVILFLELGSGVLRLEGPVITLKLWHRIHVSREGRVVNMTVDAETVRGQAPGDSNTLTLNSVLLVGGAPDLTVLTPQARFTMGFEGCIHSVQIGGDRTALLPWTSFIRSEGVTLCTHDPCVSSGCQNGASCEALVDGRYRCHCPVGFGGLSCEEVVTTIQPPSFNGMAYIIVPAAQVSLYMAPFEHPTFFLRFRPAAYSGLLFYSFSDNGFIGLCLDGGHVSLTFDIGTGATHVRSPEILDLNIDHEVLASIQGLVGFLQVNDGEVLQNTAPGSTALPLFPADVYFGGVPRTLVVPGTVPVGTGFFGCILSPSEWSVQWSGANVLLCRLPPCENHQCRNGGTCEVNSIEVLGYMCMCPFGLTGQYCESDVCDVVPDEDECKNGGVCYADGDGHAGCLCPMPFTGTTCVRDLSFAAAAFVAGSYLAYPAEIFIRSDSLYAGVRFVLRTDRSHGLLLWSGDVLGEFLMVGIKDGSLEYRINVGDGPAMVSTAPRRVDTNMWFEISIVYGDDEMKIEITDSMEQAINYPGAIIVYYEGQLNLRNELLYVGGHPGNVTEVTGGLFHTGFDGCITSLHSSLNPGLWNVVEMQARAQTGMGISPCVL